MDRRSNVKKFRVADHLEWAEAYRKLYPALILHRPEYSSIRSIDPRRPDIVRYIREHRREILDAGGDWQLPPKWKGHTRGGKRLSIDLSNEGSPRMRPSDDPKPVPRKRIPGFSILEVPTALSYAYQRLYRVLVRNNSEFRELRYSDRRRPDIRRFVHEHRDEILKAKDEWMPPDLLRMFTVGGTEIEFDMTGYKARVARIKRNGPGPGRPRLNSD